jgi:serine/threonine protein kinase/Flp pilus assembly protein TadD
MFNKRYKIVRTLGKGGWGEVNLATDTSSGDHVAIKSLEPGENVTIESVEKEIQALAGLDHPGIVKYSDSFVEDGCIYVVMEYVAGETLEALAEKGPVPLPQVRRYALQLVDALEHIHSRGIIHSDLKPENIIIDTEDNIRLIDFGIVRTASAEIASDIKEIRGTLHYMSPEQAEGNPYDIRSDLFSLGVVLYELCCGSKPFAGEYDMAVIYSILYEEPVPPDKVNPDISPSLSAAIINLLSKNPDDRPGSATHVREMLPDSFAADRQAPTPGGHRIAILPFEFPEGDDDSQLIADGLKDELYARLKRLENLDVVSPIKVSRHKNRLHDGDDIRTHLGADKYVSGSVRRIGKQLRIYLMLLSSEDDSVIWSDKFDSPMADLFDVIDSITGQVTQKLEAQLSGKSETTMPTSSTAKPEAYELYLLARGYYIKYTQKDLNYARNMFLEALKLDPDYALAHVGIADCYCTEYMDYFNRSDRTVRKATEWAQKALEIVPNLPEAYRTLGRIMQNTGKVKDAGDYFLKAVTYKEDYYQAYRSLGWLAKDCFKYDQALNWIRKTLSINSTDLETIYLKGVIHYERKESKQAINDFTRCLELRPDYGRAHSFSGMTYFQLGRVDEAIAALDLSMQLGGDINAPYLLGYYHLCRNHYKAAIDVLLDASNKPEISFLAWLYLGLARILIDETDAAADCFAAARDQSQHLLDDDPDFHVARNAWAISQAFLGETEKARLSIREVLPFIQYDGSIAHDVARTYAIIGDGESAQKYMTLAVDTYQGPTRVEIDLDPILNHFLGSGS